jgi:hypothetical protein
LSFEPKETAPAKAAPKKQAARDDDADAIPF